MSRQLLILRHAIALDREEATARGINDADRPLTDKGVKRLQQVVRGLAQLIEPPANVLCSPLLRARQSAELLALHLPAESPPAICPELAPEHSPPQLLQALSTKTWQGMMVIVGHEPQLSATVALLLCGESDRRITLKKAGAALLRFADEPAAGHATLEWLMQPGQLRRLGQAS